MGEDRMTTTTAKNGYDALPPSRQRHSSIMSSCSEDMESETNTSTGYSPSPDGEEEKEEELQYGPGIVNKLRTRFLTISLKQNRGANVMRRSCSMENLLDHQDKSSSRCGAPMSSQGPRTKDPEEQRNWGVIKRAKSMDTLLMDLQQQAESQPPLGPIADMGDGVGKKEPKIVRRRDGCLNRTGPTICDEELPKPDTVKTYKRMFEPAESRRGSHSRRPPVLRASAKSGGLSVSKINNSGAVVSPSSAKASNGNASKSSSSKLCAKQQQSSPPLVKAQPVSEVISSNNTNNNSNNSSANQPDSKPLCNGSFVKATPVKIVDNSVCNRKIEKTVAFEKAVNGLNSKKDVIVHHNNQKNDSSVFCNGNSTHKEIIKSVTTDVNFVKPDVKKLVSQTYKVLDCGSDHHNNNNKIVNGLKQAKPKVPPNRPAFVKNVKTSPKIINNELNGEKKAHLVPKLKPTPNSVILKEIAKPEINGKTDPVVIASSPSEPRLNGDIVKETKPKVTKEAKTVEGENAGPETKVANETKTVEAENNRKNAGPETKETAVSEKTNSCPKKELEKEKIINHDATDNGLKTSTTNNKKSEPTDLPLKCESKPVKKQQSSEPITTSMVFDFRGKDVVPHVAVLPVPFGCKALHPKKKPLLIDGKEAVNGDCADSDDEDEFRVDYSVPPPCGVIFEGENVKIGKGSILCTRNKDLKIKFDDNVDDNTFVYPSETSLMEDSESSLTPSPPPTTGEAAQPPPASSEPPPPANNKLKANTVIGSSGAGGLTTYTPSVLRTMDNFEPGMFRPPPQTAPPGDKEDVRSGEEENTEVRDENCRGDEDAEDEMLKPADPEIISSWSLSAGTSDLLF